jgi:hypothetical protein
LDLIEHYLILYCHLLIKDVSMLVQPRQQSLKTHIERLPQDLPHETRAAGPLGGCGIVRAMTFPNRATSCGENSLPLPRASIRYICWQRSSMSAYTSARLLTSLSGWMPALSRHILMRSRYRGKSGGNTAQKFRDPFQPFGIVVTQLYHCQRRLSAELRSTYLAKQQDRAPEAAKEPRLDLDKGADDVKERSQVLGESLHIVKPSSACGSSPFMVLDLELYLLQ